MCREGGKSVRVLTVVPVCIILEDLKMAQVFQPCMLQDKEEMFRIASGNCPCNKTPKPWLKWSGFLMAKSKNTILIPLCSAKYCFPFSVFAQKFDCSCMTPWIPATKVSVSWESVQDFSPYPTSGRPHPYPWAQGPLSAQPRAISSCLSDAICVPGSIISLKRPL